MATHAGMTTTAFEQIVQEWIQKAVQPRFHRPYTDLVFQPMQELLAYLRDQGSRPILSRVVVLSLCGPGWKPFTAFHLSK